MVNKIKFNMINSVLHSVNVKLRVGFTDWTTSPKVSVGQKELDLAGKEW